MRYMVVSLCVDDFLSVCVSGFNGSLDTSKRTSSVAVSVREVFEDVSIIPSLDYIVPAVLVVVTHSVIANVGNEFLFIDCRKCHI